MVRSLLTQEEEMEGNDYDYMFKVILLGDPGVGKSVVLLRLYKNEFDHKYKLSIGFDFASKFINVNDEIIKAVIWDTNGDERYRVPTGVMYRQTLGAFILYDVTRKVTFANVEKWLKEIRDHVDRNIVIMLVGNKTDLPHLREVQTEEAKAFSEREGIFFMETSALESVNVENAFTTVLNKIFHDVNNKVLAYPVVTPNVEGTSDDGISDIAFAIAFGDDESD